MIEWLVAVNEKCRDLAVKANDAKSRLLAGEEDTAKTINSYMKHDYDALIQLWKEVDPEMRNTGRLNDLARHIGFAMNNDYQDIVKNDIPSVLKVAEALAREGSKDAEAVGFEDLLHPAIVASSLGQYRNGHLRDAVLNGVIAVLDLIRARILLGTLGSRTGFRYRQRHGLQPHPPAKTPPPLPLRRRHRSGQHERPSSAPDPPGRQAHRGDRLRPAAVRAVPARNPRQRCGPSSGGSVRLRQPGRPWADINTVTNQLATPGIEPPASLIEDIFLDQCFNAGNRVVEHYFDQPSFVLHSG